MNPSNAFREGRLAYYRFWDTFKNEEDLLMCRLSILRAEIPVNPHAPNSADRKEWRKGWNKGCSECDIVHLARIQVGNTNHPLYEIE